jgi:predicted deacylase
MRSSFIHANAPDVVDHSLNVYGSSSLAPKCAVYSSANQWRYAPIGGALTALCDIGDPFGAGETIARIVP